jgi:hypothetical protein
MTFRLKYVLLLVVLLAAAACGDDGGAAPEVEAYFDGLEAAHAAMEERAEAWEEDVDAQFGALDELADSYVFDAEERAGLVLAYGEFRTILREFAAAVGALEPPAEARREHEALVTAYEDLDAGLVTVIGQLARCRRAESS